MRQQYAQIRNFCEGRWRTFLEMPSATLRRARLLRSHSIASLRRLSVSIRDYGPGVPEEMLSSIFKPFFRVDSARDSASGGAGLGLAIAQSAIALHHGNLSATNMHPGLLVRIELPGDLKVPAEDNVVVNIS